MEAISASAMMSGMLSTEESWVCPYCDFVHFMLTDETALEIHRTIPDLDMHDPIELSRWIIDTVFNAGFSKEESN